MSGEKERVEEGRTGETRREKKNPGEKELSQVFTCFAS